MSEATEEIQRLRDEIERLTAVDKDREKYFALMKEKGAEIEQHFDVMASERNRFNASINRLAEIVGLEGKQCFAPEAVERKAKFELATLRARVKNLGARLKESEGERDDAQAEMISAVADHEEADRVHDGDRDAIEVLETELQQAREDNSALKEYRTSVCPEERGPDDAGFTQEEAHFWKQGAERDGAEVQRLKKAATDCDFRVLKCPVLAGEDIELLDPVDSIVEVAPGTDFGEGVVDEEGSVVKMGPDGEVKQIPFPECTKFRTCPDKDCHHYEPDDKSCGRKADEDFGTPDERDEPDEGDRAHDHDMEARG